MCPNTQVLKHRGTTILGIMDLTVLQGVDTNNNRTSQLYSRRAGALTTIASYDSTADVALVAGDILVTLIPEAFTAPRSWTSREQIADTTPSRIRIVRNPAIQVRNITNPIPTSGGGDSTRSI